MVIEEISIAITHFKTSDGKIFKDRGDASIHQDVIDGKARVCPECNGEKMIDMCGDGRLNFPCSACNKTGYQWKTEVWK